MSAGEDGGSAPAYDAGLAHSGQEAPDVPVEPVEDGGALDDVDAALDEALDDMATGDEVVRDGATPSGAPSLEPGPDELPLVLSGRERFSRLDPVVGTGEARVDAATARLDEVADLPTADHVALYEDVHRRLHDALSDTDAH